MLADISGSEDDRLFMRRETKDMVGTGMDGWQPARLKALIGLQV